MNLKSVLRSLSAERSASIQNEESTLKANSNISPMGVGNHRDVFEGSAKTEGGIFQRDNFYSGKRIDADSLRQEQNYEKDSNDSKSYASGIFEAEKSYQSVILQQGRVALDSDYNDNENNSNEDDD